MKTKRTMTALDALKFQNEVVTYTTAAGHVYDGIEWDNTLESLKLTRIELAEDGDGADVVFALVALDEMIDVAAQWYNPDNHR